MSEEEKKILVVAKEFILTILNQNLTNEAFSEIYEIQTGNKEVLLKHLKAIDSIISKSIKLLGDVEDE